MRIVSVCIQYGLRIGECMSLTGTFVQPSYYTIAWNRILSMKPIILYIEPPEVTELPECEIRSVALFCLEAAQYQLRHRKHFVVVHPVESTCWTSPQASALWSNPLVSWGRMAQCPTMCLTSIFATGQLDPLLCRHRAVKKRNAQSLR